MPDPRPRSLGILPAWPSSSRSSASATPRRRPSGTTTRLHRDVAASVEPGFPLVIALERDDVLIYLSEHTGDAPPESLAYLHIEDVALLAESLGLEIEETDYGRREIEVVDLDGNRIRIGSPA